MQEDDMASDNEALVRSFFEVADRGRTPVEMCAAGFTAHFPGTPPMDLAGFDQFEAMTVPRSRAYDTRLRTGPGESHWKCHSPTAWRSAESAAKLS
jgi:hypothetical protein